MLTLIKCFNIIRDITAATVSRAVKSDCGGNMLKLMDFLASIWHRISHFMSKLMILTHFGNLSADGVLVMFLYHHQVVTHFHHK